VRVLRWILFVPAALLARALVGLCVGDPLTREASSDFAAFALLLLAYALQGAAFVLAGAITAPDRQREIGWLLAITLSVFAVVRIYWDDADQYVMSLAAIFARPVGALLTAFLLQRGRVKSG
jgi:non-ribosomal peptide synthetase component F